jgi:predicted metalloprotease with PDZ domain
MIYYHISTKKISDSFLTITMTLQHLSKSAIIIQLPSWRPGRYELQNFAKNIQSFEVWGSDNQPLEFAKINKDRWIIYPQDETITVQLNYFANVMNAGSTFIDASQTYINFVNCLPYCEGRLNETHRVQLALPDNYTIACGLPQIAPFTLEASDYYALADSPLIASSTLQHAMYEVENTPFHIWIQGNYQPNFDKITSDFRAFTEAQIAQFGEFPEKDYHFLIQMLNTPHYHGVEHRNSTVIVLGQASDPSLYDDLLGVCSHELYHAWNICKIRPVELLPYNFTKENYFPTGFVAEGVTTYLGDWFLRSSGVISVEQYLKELNVTLKRHFDKDGKAFQSLVESSFDLWLDGYIATIPNRRVSIYNKGAIVALILDLAIRQKSNHARSLHHVMSLLWQRHGKPFIGYSLADYQTIAEEVYGDGLDWYFDVCIKGNTPLEELLNTYLHWVGLEWVHKPNNTYLVVKDIENIELKRWIGIEG